MTDRDSPLRDCPGLFLIIWHLDACFYGTARKLPGGDEPALRLRPVGTGAWPSRNVWERRARHRAGGLTAAA